MKFIKFLTKALWPAVAAGLLVFYASGCSKDSSGGGDADRFNVSGILLPSSIVCNAGDAVQVKFVGGHGPVEGDILEFVSEENTYDIALASLDEDSFSFVVSGEIYSDDFALYIIRGGQKKRVGKTTLIVSGRVEVDPENYNVYGTVYCKNTPVEGVVVSDGFNVTVTDAQGVYRMHSDKKHKYVFISVPSGYTTLSDGVLPRMHKQLSKASSETERVDFDLIPAEGQDNHRILLLGDIHLARRNEDRAQFAGFVSDINSFLKGCPANTYGITLGDMTWDIYWVTNSYSFADYLNDANSIKGLTLYHTVGNHDHSMYYSGDFYTVVEYKQLVAPTYYSFNIGQVHYVVLDDILCVNSQATYDALGNPCYVRDYNCSLENAQLNWLEKDLAHVSKEMPIVLIMHIPFYANGLSSYLPEAQRKRIISLFDGHPKIHVYTGHTHAVYNKDNRSSDNIFEHNGGAICGTWWWSGYLTPGMNIGPDGAPAGYTVLDVNGTDFSWEYKPTGHDTSRQFRTYDRNMIHITTDKYVPSGNATYKAKLVPDIWGTANDGNEVYLNVWNWDPSWEIKVTEEGTELSVKQVTVKDPLHLIAYTTKRLNANAEASFEGNKTDHMFRVKASRADSTLEITVKDGNGHVYTETMTRPKDFSIDTYLN